MIDVPISEREPEARDEFFTLRADSDLCHQCLLDLVTRNVDQPGSGTRTEEDELTNEITAIDSKGKIYTINEVKATGEHRYFLNDGTRVDRMSDALFQIADTEITLRTLLTPKRNSKAT